MATTKKNADPCYVALLRGINVGGKHKLPMKDLAAMFTAAGCADVRTYIQSGNVVFRAKAPVAKRVEAAVAAAIVKKFGFEAPVIVRSADEMAAIHKRNPFLKRASETTSLHVVFLADEPARTAVASLDPDRSPPDQFVVRGREIYLHLPNGAGRSKLTNQYFDSCLKTISSGRNWNTVTKLCEMACGEASS
jgi:uncharacterized protein (DUF1697 family)